VFPPITINGRRYIDGGVRSGTNADIAKGAERVLILSLMNPERMVGPAAPIAARFEREVATVEGAGGKVETVYPDADATSVMGMNLMDPSLVVPATEAGERQGRVIADALSAFWNG
jgi:NTE family protein